MEFVASYYIASSTMFLQAIQNPNDIQLQEKAWNAVCPLVVRLKRFYEFSIRLGEYVFVVSMSYV